MEEHDAQTVTPPKKHSLAIPIAILLGFGLIALAIYFNGTKPGPVSATTTAPPNRIIDTNKPATAEMNPITEEDHIQGNPNAPIMLVEYSDFDCPACKAFHGVMERIMDEYGATGEVAWTYRHYPIEQLHPNAKTIAAASECVANLGDDEAFWKFADLVFGERDISTSTDLTKLPVFAESTGVDLAAYEACVTSGETVAAVEEDSSNGSAIGVKGTPHTFLLIGNQQFSLPSGLSYDILKSNIDSLLEQIEAALAEQPAVEAAQ